MKKLIGTLAASALALSGFTILAASPALAASGCATSTTLTSSTATAPGGTTVTLTATVKDCNGAGVSGVVVTFSQISGPCASTFSAPTATTDATGVASVTVTLPTNCPGQYVFNAAANGVNASTTVVESGGFPATSAAQPGSQGRPLGALLVVAVGALMIAGAGSAMYIQRRQRLGARS